MERGTRLAEPSPWRSARAEEVRSTIARVILGNAGTESALGGVILHPHQVSAVQRLHVALDQFGGALLCDDVGTGKTYVALAVARRFTRCLVVAPAALTSMWQHALAWTSIDAKLLTFEALSRDDLETRAGTPRPLSRYDLVIIDEAHHARNPRTNRYFALESLVRGARVLLLTATPIHNHRSDLVALLSLFLGSRAASMTFAELALCIVRREKQLLTRGLRIPGVRPLICHDVPDDKALVEQLMTLPPPVAVRDGGAGGVLVGRGLLHQWASSEAALREAIKRRIARAAALCSSLEAGTYPSARELETWIYGDGALQLGFAELLSPPASGHAGLLAAVRAHLASLEVVRAGLGAVCVIDTERARILARIRERDGGKIVAFAQYAETVSALYRRLGPDGRVAMLTSHGARVAGGTLTRAEAISRFAPHASGSSTPAPAEVIDLLLTTDLLSEGVNLQDAGTVIHLDIPWTVARMEQRVGRVARLGSPHAAIQVHLIRPPRSASAILESEAIVRRKWNLARISVGTGAPNPAFGPKEPDSQSAAPESAPASVERLRRILETWLVQDTSGEVNASQCAPPTIVATVIAPSAGFIAAVSMDGCTQLIAGSSAGVTTDLPAQTEWCAAAQDSGTATDPAEVTLILGTIRKWHATQRAAMTAGLGASGARRRKLTNRIDASIEDAPPHLRASRRQRAARARQIVTAPQCAAVERDLEELLKSELPADEWLAAVAGLDARGAGHQRQVALDEELRIHAILILSVRPPLSRSPRGRESP